MHWNGDHGFAAEVDESCVQLNHLIATEPTITLPQVMSDSHNNNERVQQAGEKEGGAEIQRLKPKGIY